MPCRPKPAHSQATCPRLVYGGFGATGTELSSYGPQAENYLHSRPLRKEFADLWPRTLRIHGR